MEFEYKAIGADGKVVSGKKEANSRSDMVKILKEQGMSLLDLNEITKEKVKGKSAGKVAINLEFGISHTQLMFFTRQLASLLHAGIPILRCLDMLHDQTVSKKLREVIRQVSADMQQGKSLSDSMRPHNPPFNELYVSMVKVGETTGDLSKTISNLATSLENQNQIKQKIKSAISYPIFIVIFSAALVYGMITMILPAFTPIFKDSGLDIARDYPLTQMLINISELVSNVWFLPVLAGIILAIYIVYRVTVHFPRGKLFIDTVVFYFPFIQGLIQMQNFSQMADLMSSLLDSGVSLVDVLKLTANSFDSQVMKNALLDTAERVEKGKKLSTSLIETGVYSQMMSQMVAVGEDTGNLADMLRRTSDYYSQELDGALSSLVSLIEPVMMIGVGVMVFFLVVGIFLPIMGISQAYEQSI